MDSSSLQEVLANLVTKVGNAGEKYGPDMLNLVGQYQHWMGVFHILIGVVLLGISAFFWKNFFNCCAKALDSHGDPNRFFGAAAICLIAGAFTALAGLINALDPDNWIAAISPKLALVQLAVNSVSNHH